jgi:hypothetical protein
MPLDVKKYEMKEKEGGNRSLAEFRRSTLTGGYWRCSAKA